MQHVDYSEAQYTSTRCQCNKADHKAITMCLQCDTYIFPTLDLTPVEPLLNPIDVTPWNQVPPFSTPPPLLASPPLACLSCPYPLATLVPLPLACLRQASCPVLLVKSFGHFGNSCGNEHANGEGGVATVLVFPDLTEPFLISESHGSLRRRRRKRHP